MTPETAEPPRADPTQPHRGHESRFWAWREAQLVIAAGLMISAAVAVFWSQQYESELELRRSELAASSRQSVDSLQRELARVESDLLFLAEIPAVRDLEAGESDGPRLATEYFEDFAQARGVYFQLRVIDRSGEEVVRVEWDTRRGQHAASQQLQDKSQRYYVQRGLDLAPGEVFVSEFDLNVERGQIERPLRPALRVVTPVRRDDGEPGALVVLNYDASRFIDDLSQVPRPVQAYLMRPDGHFLKGPTPQDEWGWLLGHDRRLSTVFPGLSEIANPLPESGVSEATGDGVVHFRALPISSSPDNQAEFSPPPLILMHLLAPKDAMGNTSSSLWRLSLLGLLTFLSLAGVIHLWNAASARHIEAEQQLQGEAMLAEANAELQRVNAELDRFTSIVSHDLRAPLRSIDQVSSWLAEDLGDSLPEDSARHIQQLRGRVGRMQRLLEDLLAYSRVDKKLGLAEPLSPRECVDEVLLLAPPPEGFEVRQRHDVESVTLPRTAVELILRNLIGNAIKHHDQDHGVITVATRFDADRFVLSVEDDGPGVPPEHRERVFEVFQTLRPRDEVEASGLGLSMVLKVAKSLGGSVEIESAEPRGARFVVRLPRDVPSTGSGNPR